MGREILRAGALFLSVCLWAGLLPRVEAADPAPCGLKRLASIALTQDPGGALVPVTINGKSAQMYFDFGYSSSFIVADSLDRLSLHAEPIPIGARAVITIHGVRVEKHVRVDGFSIGPVPFRRVDLLVGVPSGRVAPDTVVGIIGADMLADLDMELDPVHHAMNLYSTDHCRGKVVYWSNDFAVVPLKRGELSNYYLNYFIPVELEGRTIEAGMALSAGRSLLADSAYREIRAGGKSQRKAEGAGAAGASEPEDAALDISTGGQTFIHARIRLFKTDCALSVRGGAIGFDLCRGVYPLQLGNDVLSQLHLYLASKEKMLYFTAANASLGASAGTEADNSPAESSP